MIDLYPPADALAALRKRESAPEKANVYFRVCPLCAFAAWVSTVGEGSGQTHVELDEHACSKCQEMRYRHGELFDYLLYIIRGQRLIDEMRSPQATGVDNEAKEK